MVGKILIQGSIFRAAYGILALLFPKLLLAAVGMKEDDLETDARYFNRLLGGRELLVAAATMAAVKSGAQGQATKANLICEITDSISLVEELRARGGLNRLLLTGFAFNLGGYATWLRALHAL